MQWTGTWKDACLEFFVSALDSFGTLTPVRGPLSIYPQNGNLKMLIVKVL